MSYKQRPEEIRISGGKSVLELWLASVPCVSSACERPPTAPLTPAEVERFEEYPRTRRGPASNGRADRG
jgi:hypothetical protein